MWKGGWVSEFDLNSENEGFYKLEESGSEWVKIGPDWSSCIHGERAVNAYSFANRLTSSSLF